MTTLVLNQQGVRDSSVDDPDARLVRRFLKDPEPHVFAELVRRHEGPVFRLCVSILGPGFEADAEDLTQEIFLHVYHSLSGFRFASKFSTWLYRVSYRKAIDLKRRARFSKPHSDTRSLEARQGTAPDALDDVLAAERRAALLAAVEELPLSQRAAVRLFYWRECSIEDIAALLDARPATVRSWLFRARQHLAEFLES